MTDMKEISMVPSFVDRAKLCSRPYIREELVDVHRVTVHVLSVLCGLISLEMSPPDSSTLSGHER